jgi:uncharacterized protein YoxC
LQKIKFESKITNFENINPLFSRVKVRIAYTGLNRNNSYISKEAFEKALPTIYRCPIIGEYNESVEDFMGHGGKLEISDEGIKWIQTTQPYGVIDSDSEITWEEVTEDDGTVREYLCATGYLWTGRYPELSKVIENSSSQSMEIEVESGEYATIDGTKCYNIKDFVFSGFCILGDNVEPCFESSEVMAYSLDKDKFKQDFTQLLFELKKSFESNDSANDKVGEKIDIDNSKDAADMSGDWGSVDKSKLRKSIVGASNASSLVREAYLIVDNSWEDSPSESLHYPHHVIKDGKLVVHKKGLEAAYARLMQNDPKNKKAIRHVKKHYKELGLDMSNFSLEGGFEVENLQEMLAKYNLSIEDLQSKDINHEEFSSIDELEAKIQEVFKQEEPPVATFTLTSEQLEDELRRELAEIETLSDPYWPEYQYPRYCYVDNKLDENVVIAWDCKNSYLVGGTFTVQNDNVEISGDALLRYKVDYNPMNLSGDSDGAAGVLIPGEVSDYKLKVKEFELKQQFEIEKEIAIAEQKSEFEKLQSELNTLKEQYAALEARANQIESDFAIKVQKEREDAEVAIFESFSKELSEDEMADIKAKKSEYGLDEIQDKLFALVGKKKAKFSFNKEDKPLRINIITDKTKTSDKSWADLVEQYTNQ